MSGLGQHPDALVRASSCGVLHQFDALVDNAQETDRAAGLFTQL